MINLTKWAVSSFARLPTLLSHFSLHICPVYCCEFLAGHLQEAHSPLLSLQSIIEMKTCAFITFQPSNMYRRSKISMAKLSITTSG